MDTPATVDAYFASLPTRSRSVLDEVRAAIRAAAPDATEAISYAMPAFRSHGRGLVAYAAFSDHWSLFPMGGGVLDRHAAELAPYRSGKGTLRFSYDDPVPIAIVTLVVEARLAENAARVAR